MAAFDNSNLNDRVYLYLRDQILHNVYKPGDQIVYEQLIQELGVSRTPLRDAINRLVQDGLIEVKPRSGSFVYMPNAQDIGELYDVRKALECQAIEAALPRMSPEELEGLLREADEADEAIRRGDVQRFFEADRTFHRTIIERSGNGLLAGIMGTLELRIIWFGVIITKFDRPQQANDMHRRIIQAMASRNVALAKQLMGEHIEDIRRYTIGDYA